jgi:hypothetical protein
MALRIIERRLGQMIETLSDGSKQVLCGECDGTGDAFEPLRIVGGITLGSQCDACRGTGQDREATKALEVSPGLLSLLLQQRHVDRLPSKPMNSAPSGEY